MNAHSGTFVPEGMMLENLKKSHHVRSVGKNKNNKVGKNERCDGVDCGAIVGPRVPSTITSWVSETPGN